MSRALLTCAVIGCGALAFAYYQSSQRSAPPKSLVSASPDGNNRPREAATSASGAQKPIAHVAATVHYDLLSTLLQNERRAAPGEAWLRELTQITPVQSQHHPLLEQQAPDFSLLDHRGQPWTLRNELTKGPVVLIFYLGYFCNACVHGLCEANADLERYQHFGAQVVAVSADAQAVTRQRFEEYGRFDFPMLADADHAVAETYRVFTPGEADQPEMLLHATFIIARDGRIRWAYRGDAPFRSSMAVLREIAAIENQLPTLTVDAPSPEVIAP